ncbi:response regulator [Coralloluteibacterium thermophilus]|uniref:Response regulator n=1 Tax=Coralloluteibacterium thermophilum TaxID=2707049 RepID=A0ABV9NNS1_9GAMM
MHSSGAPTRPRVLLVEDDPASRGFLAQALEALPVQVDVAADLGEARLRACDAHVLWLSDANLPDGSGEEFVLDVRARFPQVPALALTAGASEERRASLRQAGFLAVLLKPIGVQALHEAVRAHVPALAPAWDEAQALAAANGNAATASALRDLFLSELPGQREQVLAALARGDHASARTELHRLKSGCGFVGARRLRAAVLALDAALADPACRSGFERAVEEILTTQAA